MSRQAKLALAVLAGAILIAVLMIALRPAPAEKPREQSAPLVRALPFKADSGPIAVLGSGTVQPREEVTVGAQVAGRLVYVNPDFREGGTVGSGAVLFRIDASDYRNRVRSAQADVAAQDVAVLQAREEAAIARDELQRYAGQRDRDLIAETIDSNDYASRILPPRNLQTASPPSQGNGAPARLATREPQLRSARAARERAAAQLADARLSLGRTVVASPFAGIVRSETASVGTLVQPGQELGSIVATSSYEVRVSLTESEAALIPGLLNGSASRIPAQVFFEYGKVTYRWNAFVDRADALLDAETRTIDVFLRVPDPLRGGVPVDAGGTAGSAPPLLLGSFVRARITGASTVAYAEVPVQAVRPGNEVWIVRGGKLRILPVRVLQRSDDIAYVTTPTLAQGGQLVTSSLRAPVDGMAVRVEKPAAKKAAADD
ncbi:MAG: HlyD family efflux transporter periplasmic adaptor subunit [Novosphingobium sp.]|nr:HlyD family efflux transporter periplasmic adaptor subunit [Novosphingobium sp.]